MHVIVFANKLGTYTFKANYLLYNNYFEANIIAKVCASFSSNLGKQVNY